MLADPFYPRFWEERLTAFHVPRKADSPKKGIFVCDMGDLFGDCIPQSWQEQVFNAIKANPDYRFYLLTKQPGNLIKWSPFPDNCYVGVTATNRKMFCEAIRDLKEVKATVKYISMEPCLERVISNDGWIFDGAKDVPVDDAFMMKLAGVNWLIIGPCTGSLTQMKELFWATDSDEVSVMPWGKKWTAQPKIEWVQEIVEAADKAAIPVFQKDNLRPLLGNNLRQEMPKGEK